MSEMVDSLYFIRSLDSGLVKIGHTHQPAQRLKTLKRETRETLEFAFLGYGGRQAEKTYHEEFKADREHGEWFRPSPRMDHLIGVITDEDIIDDYRLDYPAAFAYWGEWAMLLGGAPVWPS